MGCGASRKFGSSKNDLPIASICHTDTSYNSEYARCEQESPNDNDDTLENGNTSQNSSSTSLDYSVLPECELFEAGEADNAQKRFQACGCKDNFYPVNHSNYSNLPPMFHTLNKYGKDRFYAFCDRTVKLQVMYTSKNRPDTYPDSTAPYPYAKYKGSKRVGRCGTGFIYEGPSVVKRRRCPCPECANNQTGKPKMAYFEIKVSTAAHVIFDDSEASQTICEVFYDSEKRDTVKVLYGIEGVSNRFGFIDGYDIGSYTDRSANDLFYLKCVSHDVDSYNKLKSSLALGMLFRIEETVVPVIISHPHGACKQISFGTFWYFCLQMTPGHTRNTPYTIPARKALLSNSSTLDCQYPDLFEYIPRKRYTLTTNTQPLRLFVQSGIVTGNKNEIVIRCLECSPFLFQLPSGSKVTNMDMTLEYPKEDFWFLLNPILAIFKDNIVSHHMAYDAPTCRGSSGAFVKAPVYTSTFFPHHFGKDTNGRNRTGEYSHLG